jgi:hypothetical protein
MRATVARATWTSPLHGRITDALLPVTVLGPLAAEDEAELYYWTLGRLDEPTWNRNSNFNYCHRPIRPLDLSQSMGVSPSPTVFGAVRANGGHQSRLSSYLSSMTSRVAVNLTPLSGIPKTSTIAIFSRESRRWWSPTFRLALPVTG